jgi:hypothetical protein
MNLGLITNMGLLTNNGSMTNTKNFDILTYQNDFNNPGNFNNNSSFINQGTMMVQGIATNSSLMLFQSGQVTIRRTLRNFGLLNNLASAVITVIQGSLVNGNTFTNEGTLNNTLITGVMNYFLGVITGYTGPMTQYAITAQPQNSTVVQGGAATFTTTATGIQVTYQWQLSADNGGTWINLADGGNYSGSKASGLRISLVPLSFNQYLYRCIVTGPQPGNTATTLAATLTVNQSKRK